MEEKRNLKCVLFGHKEINDGGFYACERCKSHAYYDGNDYFDKFGYLRKPFWFIKRKFYELKFFIQRTYRRIFLGDDLPF